MDFTLPPEATDAAELAATIFTDHCTPERLRAVDAGGDRFDRDLWAALGTAGLLGLTVPEEHGGAGLGPVELAAVLVEAGSRVAPVPLAGHGVAAAALAEYATPEMRARWLDGAATGEVVLAVAPAADRSGAHNAVVAGAVADAVLVPVGEGADARLVLITPTTPGVTIEPQRLTDGDIAARLVVPHDVDAPVLGDGSVVRWVADRIAVAGAAAQLGVVGGALRLTAAYARTREQFGRPIGTFQAVSQRLADGYIDVLGARLTLWQAAWRLAEGLPAEQEVATAVLWAADAGHRLAHTTVHVHGGVGIDLDGEAHRFFTAAKRGEFLLGGTTAAARAIGAALASA
ncbi:MAG: acyl-CoA dehydrogenase family protein [Marmoricola sp.]